MPLHIRDGGAWKQVKRLWVRDAGSWKEVKAAWIRDAGSWKQTFVNIAITFLTDDSEPRVPSGWRTRALFNVSDATESVQVHTSVDGGSFTLLQQMNVTPGSTGNESDWTNLNTGQTLEFRLTPYSENDAGGLAGDQAFHMAVEP
jgi:hypothetical protein